MGVVPAETTVKSRKRRWLLRAVVGLCAGLGLLIGGVMSHSHLREQRVAEFVRRFRGRGGSIQRGYGSELSQWLDQMRRAWAETLLGWELMERRSEIVGLGRSSLSKEETPILGDMPCLKEIDLEETPFTSELCSRLAGLKSLGSLALQDSMLTDDSFRELCRALEGHRELTSLYLGKTQMTNEGIKELSRLKNVTSLSIESPHLNGEALKLLVGRPMTALHFIKWKLTGGDIAFIVDQWSGTLQYLSIGGKEISAKELLPLQKCSSLLGLILREVTVTPEMIKNFPQLLIVSLEATALDLKAAEVLADLGVEAIGLVNVRLPSHGLKVLGRNEFISSLALSDSQIGDSEVIDFVAGVQSIPAGTWLKLHHLGLSETTITDRAIQEIKSLTKLTSLVLRKCKITDAALEEIASWDLNGRQGGFQLNVRETGVTREGIARLGKKQPKMKIESDFGTTETE